MAVWGLGDTYGLTYILRVSFPANFKDVPLKCHINGTCQQITYWHFYLSLPDNQTIGV